MLKACTGSDIGTETTTEINYLHTSGGLYETLPFGLKYKHEKGFLYTGHSKRSTLCIISQCFKLMLLPHTKEQSVIEQADISGNTTAVR